MQSQISSTSSDLDRTQELFATKTPHAPVIPVETITKKKSHKSLIIIIISIVVLLLLVLGTVFLIHSRSAEKNNTSNPGKEQSTNENDSSSNDETKNAVVADDLSIVAHDINFSKINDQRSDLSYLTFDKNAVDCLLLVNNNSDEPIKSFAFDLFNGDHKINDRMGEDNFKAYGYVPAHDSGFMYSALYLSDTEGKSAFRGTIKITEVLSSGALNNDYDIPGGFMGSYNKSHDSYSVTISNPNDVPIKKGATILAIKRDALQTKKLDGAWGAGELDTDIAAHDEYSQSNTIYNPGLNGIFNADDYSITVFDNDAL